MGNLPLFLWCFFFFFKLKKHNLKSVGGAVIEKKNRPSNERAISPKKRPAEAAASGAYCIRIPDAHALRFARLFAFRCVRHRIRNRGIQGLTCIGFGWLNITRMFFFLKRRNYVTKEPI